MQTHNGTVGHDVQVSSDVSDQAPGPSGEPTGRGAAAAPVLVAPSLDDPVVNAASDAVGGPLGVLLIPFKRWPPLPQRGREFRSFKNAQ